MSWTSREMALDFSKMHFSHSLVNVRASRYPVSFGNYCSFGSNVGFWRPGTRCVNMWMENIDYLIKLEQPRLDGTFYQEDDRRYFLFHGDQWLAEEGYYTQFCFTGCQKPSNEVLEDMAEKVGYPEEDLKEFTNPKEYWEARGATYENGVITHALYQAGAIE